VGFTADAAAQDTGIVPRPIIYGNFCLCGVCLAYVDASGPMKRVGTGFNGVSRVDGERVHASVLDLVRRGEVKPLVGLEVPFSSLPAALEKLEHRETTGRIVVRLTDDSSAPAHSSRGAVEG
jgi:NADPH2:quinone reductase